MRNRMGLVIGKAHLDADSRPVAPGPHGGVQDATGNFGAPMSGVITVSPSH